MPEIGPIGGSGSSRPVDPIKNTRPVHKKETIKSREEDKLEISSDAKIISDVRNLPEVRQDKIEELKAKLQNGEFESQESFNRLADTIRNVVSGFEETA